MNHFRGNCNNSIRQRKVRSYVTSRPLSRNHRHYLFRCLIVPSNVGGFGLCYNYFIFHDQTIDRPRAPLSACLGCLRFKLPDLQWLHLFGLQVDLLPAEQHLLFLHYPLRFLRFCLQLHRLRFWLLPQQRHLLGLPLGLRNLQQR